MMDKPLISIVVPVYNTAAYLQKCLDSIINQTYTNIEIIVGNNSSQDNSLDIIKEYQFRDSRIKILQYSYVPTVNESRTKCIVESSSEWIIPVDSDDYVALDFVERLWKRHQETQADFVGGKMVFVDESGNKYKQIPNETFNFDEVVDNETAVKYTIGDWLISGNGALRRKSVMLKDSSVYNNLLFETDETELRYILRDSPIVAFCEAEYYYNYNPNSVGKSPSWRKYDYNITTYRGLLGFIEKYYGTSSNEWRIVAQSAMPCLVSAIKYYSSNNKPMNSGDRKKAKKVICQLIRRMTRFATIPILLRLVYDRFKG